MARKVLRGWEPRRIGLHDQLASENRPGRDLDAYFLLDCDVLQGPCLHVFDHDVTHDDQSCFDRVCADAPRALWMYGC